MGPFKVMIRIKENPGWQHELGHQKLLAGGRLVYWSSHTWHALGVGPPPPHINKQTNKWKNRTRLLETFISSGLSSTIHIQNNFTFFSWFRDVRVRYRVEKSTIMNHCVIPGNTTVCVTCSTLTHAP